MAAPRRRIPVAIAFLVAVLGMARAAAAASVTIQWDANTEPDIAGYIVQYGTRSGVYDHRIDVGNTTTATIAIDGPGTYYFVVSAYSPQGTSDPSAEVSTAIAASNPFIDLDTPRPGQVVTSAFEVGGWALDTGAATGTGVDAVVFYVFPNAGAAPGVYVGQGSYGITRTDVGALFGSPFTNSGFHFTISGISPGSYTLGSYARSTVTGGFTILKMVPFTVNATALMAVNPPAPESTITSSTFIVAGWSIDRTVESTALPGTGVDTLHVYAYPNPGSGTPPIFLGVATIGFSRPDVAALFGLRYDPSGYYLLVDRAALGLAPGVYSIAVISHSQVSGSFNNLAVVRVILQ
jgi:hypothetical protein